MSEPMNSTEFENLMDEYLRDELSQEQKLAFEEYLELHPESQVELEEIRGILTVTDEIVSEKSPAGLAELAGAGLKQQLNLPAGKNSGWFKRPAFAWSLAASLLMVIGLTLWPTDSSFVYARLIESLKAIESVKAEGWIRGENGTIIPYRQWVIADGTLRAELGEADHQRVVVLSGNDRLIKDFDGQIYHDNTEVMRAIDLEIVFDILQSTYQKPHVAEESFEYSKEDLESVVRYQRQEYASLGRGPSNRKWIMEVDKATALPTILQLHQQVDGRWVQISDLRFSEFNTPPDKDHFLLEGTSLPLTSTMRQRFWFELFIGPASIYMPAAHVPASGMELYWPTAEEMPEGMSSGASTGHAGGVTMQEFRAMGLESILMSLTGKRVRNNDLSQRRVSLLFSSKSVIPWQQKLEPVLDHLELTYEVHPRVNIQRRYIFGQDGRKIQTTLHRFGDYSVHADTAGYKYHFEKTKLQRVAQTLLGNCNHQDAYSRNDTLIFVWDGSSEDNPFEFNVDLECEIPHATFETNVEFLREHFGLTMKIEENKTEIMEIVLIKK